MAGPIADGNAQHQQAHGGGLNWGSVVRAIIISYLLSTVFSSYMSQKPKEDLETSDRPPSSPTRGQLSPWGLPGTPFDIEVSIEGVDVPPQTFRNIPLSFNMNVPKISVPIDTTACQRDNCTIAACILMTIGGKSQMKKHNLVTFREEKSQTKKHNLFGAQNTTEQMPPSPVRKAYFQDTLTLSPIVDATDPLPSQLHEFVEVDPSTGRYLPILYVNNFWVLSDHLKEMNATTNHFTLEVQILPLSILKFSFYTQFDQSIDLQSSLGGTSDHGDDVKRIFLETNIILLATTMLVSILHLVFEYLAFSNDVAFWRQGKDFKGLSLKSVALSCYFQTVIFLYLLDGETSWTVIIPSGVGVLIEYWKLLKTIKFEKSETGQWRVTFSKSYDSETRTHDDTAIRYLFYIMVPGLIGYGVYSAVYDIHKGWYSFLILTQVRFIYFFGFAMMTPQIFINYKLKTVAQLPWRTFVYKALNTVIDDLFAFIIKMPWLHRLACFRDDVVFLILFYQRYIYPVDKNRTEDGASIKRQGTEETGTGENSPNIQHKEKID